MRGGAEIIQSFAKKGFWFGVLSFRSNSFSMFMYVFNVGAGSFILFKYRNGAFIVNCGNYLNDIYREFRELVKRCNLVRIK